MKKAIVSMVLMAIFLIGGGGLISIILSFFIGGGISESYLYPLYAGIIVTIGVIIGEAEAILRKLTEIKELLTENKQK